LSAAWQAKQLFFLAKSAFAQAPVLASAKRVTVVNFFILNPQKI
jgi:hypothetical protein